MKKIKNKKLNINDEEALNFILSNKKDEREKIALTNKKKKIKNIQGKGKNKKCYFNDYLIYIILILVIIFLILVIYYFYILNPLPKFLDNSERENIFIPKKVKPINYTELRLKNEELERVRNFVNPILYNQSYMPIRVFNKLENPKISIVISVYNGEGYLKTALLSIQKQDFQDIEIIMVDDHSKDNSVALIKELMLIDQRIILYQNNETRGALYTKTKGILQANAKYVMVLDEDDIYTQNNTFSTIYRESEKNNLDILGFGAIRGGLPIDNNKIPIFYMDTPVLFQPKILDKMFLRKSRGRIYRIGYSLWNYLFKTELFKKVIKLVDDKFLNRTINFSDDALLFFLLTRNAYNFKQIKKIFYFHYQRKIINSQAIAFRENEKSKNYQAVCCLGHFNYIEFLLMKTNKNIYDKKLAFFELKKLYFNNIGCRNNKYVRNEGIRLCQMFYNNKYIEKEDKEIIIHFLKQKRYKYRFIYKPKHFLINLL